MDESTSDLIETRTQRDQETLRKMNTAPVERVLRDAGDPDTRNPFRHGDFFFPHYEEEV